jgi:hypothetical protein
MKHGLNDAEVIAIPSIKRRTFDAAWRPRLSDGATSNTPRRRTLVVEAVGQPVALSSLARLMLQMHAIAPIAPVTPVTTRHEQSRDPLSAFQQG